LTDFTEIVKTLNPSSDDNQELNAKLINFDSNQDVKCYDLQIDNKYYFANIHLFDMANKDLVSRQFADSVHGVILYFDNNQVITIFIRIVLI